MINTIIDLVDIEQFQYSQLANNKGLKLNVYILIDS